MLLTRQALGRRTPQNPWPLLASGLLVLLVGIAGTRAARAATPSPEQDPATGSQDGDQGGQRGARSGGRPQTGASGGLTREQMWFAPTAEDWAKPVAITFQRTYEDAVAVSKETGKPILVCVNMDGEIASEHYAGIRYRDPEIARLYEPYVCVIASVYRHNPKDYDEEGNRILCPRFGSVTCGEHIWIEPLIYEKFLDGRRIAPRHIGVELDGSEMYDIFYAFDTDSVFQGIADGVANRPPTPEPPPRGDRTLADRVGSKDVEDRLAVEEAYRDGDAETRSALLDAAAALGEEAPVDLLRMAVFGFDTAASAKARKALAQSTSGDAVDLISEALRVPMPEEERSELIAALKRLGQATPRARTLAAVHEGLASESTSMDVGGWSEALAGADYSSAATTGALEETLDIRARTAASAEETLALAEVTLEFAVSPSTRQGLASDPITAEKYMRLMFEDALRATERARELGATGWKVEATRALVDYYMGDRKAGFERAVKAVDAMPEGDDTWTAMALLGLFAEARREAITRAVAAGEEWPSEWLTDVHATYSVLAEHPRGTEGQVIAHVDFLRFLGGGGQALRTLERGLRRFPDSATLHERMRSLLINDRGIDALERYYERRLSRADAAPTLPWFAGYAMLVKAEFHRRQGQAPEAMASYGRAIGLYERSASEWEESRDGSLHYVAMAHAGRARVAFDARDNEAAVGELLLAFETRPASAASLDGMNLSAVSTAQQLLVRLRDGGESELAARLQAGVDALDPALLRMPDFERERPRDASPDRPRPGRRR